MRTSRLLDFLTVFQLPFHTLEAQLQFHHVSTPSEVGNFTFSDSLPQRRLESFKFACNWAALRGNLQLQVIDN